MQRSVYNIEERTRGNQLYQQTTRDDIPSWTKQQCLQECLPFYHRRRAFQFTKNEDERTSAKKNLAHEYTAGQMAGTFQLIKTEIGRLNHFMIQSIETYKMATAWGKFCKTEQWLSDISHYIEVCVSTIETTIVLIRDKREKRILSHVNNCFILA